MIYSPAISLLIFFMLVALITLVYKVSNSDWVKQNFKESKKTLIEDVLKQLYHVEYSSRRATLNAMAGALKISDKRLLKIVEEMSERELIRIDDNTLYLTASGRDYALKIIRVHRLWEKYLSEKTGFDKSEWHDRAERKEHLLTDQQTDELNKALGNPRYDPHGDPIPTESGEIVLIDGTPLSNLSNDTRARIIHIEDEPDVIYKQILNEKLHVGSQLKVINSTDNEVKFLSEGESHRLSAIVASNISVKELTEEENYEGGMIRLSSLLPGEKASIVGLSSECRGANRRRLLDLGFIEGSEIETEFESPLREPRAYSIRNTIIALRDNQADFVLIKKINE